MSQLDPDSPRVFQHQQEEEEAAAQRLTSVEAFTIGVSSPPAHIKIVAGTNQTDAGQDFHLISNVGT